MASPNFNALVVRLSRMLSDPVATYGVDGVTYTSLMRVEYLNQAFQTMWNILYKTFKETYRRDNFKINRYADFIVNTTGTTDANCKITAPVTKKVIELIQFGSLTYGTFRILSPAEAMLFEIPKSPPFTASEQNPVAYLDYPDRAYIYVKPVVANFKTKSFTYTYLTYPQVMTVDYATDIEWNPSFWGSLLKLAVAHALLDDGNAEAYQMMYQSVVQEYLEDITDLKEYQKK